MAHQTYPPSHYSHRSENVFVVLGGFPMCVHRRTAPPFLCQPPVCMYVVLFSKQSSGHGFQRRCNGVSVCACRIVSTIHFCQSPVFSWWFRGLVAKPCRCFVGCGARHSPVLLF
ncbi:unnamed protein product, partial [Ectocarpus sp. 13 AM-2016]